MINKKEFKGEFKNLLLDFIKHKRSLGYKYTTISENLMRFSIFSVNYDIKNKVLSKEIVEDWIARRKSESVKTQDHRVSELRQFALYLQSLGHEAYIPSKQSKVQRNEYIPYIFTNKEIQNFFHACDHIIPHRSSIKHYVLPVLFRLLYCCGLRISEAINLKVSDVDLDFGIIKVLDSKFGHDRLIPMSESLTVIFKSYFEKININTNYHSEDHFFINKDRTGLTSDNVYKNFRNILWKAGISHGGKGKGPRLHDFRHTHCVHTLNKMVKQGVDLYCALPILSVYIGHTSTQSTQRYVRLTSEIYPELIEKISKVTAHVLPEVNIK